MVDLLSILPVPDTLWCNDPDVGTLWPRPCGLRIQSMGKLSKPRHVLPQIFVKSSSKIIPGGLDGRLN